MKCHKCVGVCCSLENVVSCVLVVVSPKIREIKMHAEPILLSSHVILTFNPMSQVFI